MHDKLLPHLDVDVLHVCALRDDDDNHVENDGVMAVVATTIQWCLNYA
jgi:hypothetical protein